MKQLMFIALLIMLITACAKDEEKASNINSVSTELKQVVEGTTITRLSIAFANWGTNDYENPSITFDDNFIIINSKNYYALDKIVSFRFLTSTHLYILMQAK